MTFDYYIPCGLTQVGYIRRPPRVVIVTMYNSAITLHAGVVKYDDDRHIRRSVAKFACPQWYKEMQWNFNLVHTRLSTPASDVQGETLHALVHMHNLTMTQEKFQKGGL